MYTILAKTFAKALIKHTLVRDNHGYVCKCCQQRDMNKNQITHQEDCSTADAIEFLKECRKR